MRALVGFEWPTAAEGLNKILTSGRRRRRRQRQRNGVQKRQTRERPLRESRKRVYLFILAALFLCVYFYYLGGLKLNGEKKRRSVVSN